MAAETGRAVCAVRGVRSAWSMVPGRPPCDPGRATPLSGRPLCVLGLHTRGKAGHLQLSVLIWVHSFIHQSPVAYYHQLLNVLKVTSYTIITQLVLGSTPMRYFSAYGSRLM